MKLTGGISVLSAALLAGCAPLGAPAESDTNYESAMTKCAEMASEAMPNGMQDPNDPNSVLDSEAFCRLLAEGYSREKFAELYNDPAWLANELRIWSDEGLPE